MRSRAPLFVLQSVAFAARRECFTLCSRGSSEQSRRPNYHLCFSAERQLIVLAWLESNTAVRQKVACRRPLNSKGLLFRRWDAGSEPASLKTMDTSSKRKFSLDSKSSSSGHQYDLRFTRRKLNNNYKWCCCGLATFLTFMLLASLAVYWAYETMEDEEQTLLTFRANFRVTSGDAFEPSLVDTNSTVYRKKTRGYKELINLLVRRSEHRVGFVGTEILALDGVDEKGMAVHFRLHYDRDHANVTSEQLRTLFHKLVNRTQTVRSEHFNRLIIDPESIFIGEPGMNDEDEIPRSFMSDQSVQIVVSTTTTEPPPTCTMSKLSYCNHENITVYPNVFGHRNQEQVTDDLVRFREIVDSECHPLGAFNFVCKLLQPACEDPLNVTLPLTCFSECESFMDNCKERLSEDLQQRIDCEQEEIFDRDC